MKEGIHDLLSKAEQSIDAARHLMKDGFHDFAASRAYYAMFYSLEALFLSRDRGFSKHSAVIAAFGKDFIKTGIFDDKYHRYILDAFDLRNTGDYGVINSVIPKKASEIIDKAGEFINVISVYLHREDR
jgi:uncharacterized protein (UPF0332 family)